MDLFSFFLISVSISMILIALSAAFFMGLLIYFAVRAIRISKKFELVADSSLSLTQDIRASVNDFLNGLFKKIFFK